MNAIRYASGFSGIGGFDLALDRLGFKRVWSCDWSSEANQIYYKRFKPKRGTHLTGDIRRVNPEDVPDHELFCAGFPCPSFSLAGKREGFGDQRGEVFFEIPRIVKVKRPQMLLLENVPGIFSHDGGRTFQIILNSLEELGYLLEWQVLNSKYFGVPQNRERVFIIGHLRRGSTRPIFPITTTDEMAKGENTGKTEHLSLAIDANYWKGPDKHGARTVIGVTLANKSRYNQGVKRTPLKQDDSSFALNASGDQGVAISFTNPHNPDEKRKMNLSSETRAVKPYLGNQQPLILSPINYAHKAGDGISTRKRKITNIVPALQADAGHTQGSYVLLHNIYGGFKEESPRIFEKNAPTLRTPKGGGHIPTLLTIGNIYPSGGEAGKIHSKNGIFSTVKQGKRGGKAGVPPIFDGLELRRLTPTECERLQGFPDGWTEGLSDTARYRVLGNAVTVNVIEYLGKLILAEFTNESDPK